MSNEKQDLRVIKTKNNIRTAFISLLLKKEFSAITVREILEMAMINRKTFYTYYEDKYDLVEQIVNDLYCEMMAFLKLRNANLESSRQSLKNVEMIYAKLYEDKDEILALWNVRTEKIDVTKQLQDILRQEFITHIPSDVSEQDQVFQAFLFSTLVLNTIKYMLESEHKYTAQEIKDAFLGFGHTLSSSIPFLKEV